MQSRSSLASAGGRTGVEPGGGPPGPDVLQVFVTQDVVTQQIRLALREGQTGPASAGLSDRPAPASWRLAACGGLRPSGDRRSPAHSAAYHTHDSPKTPEGVTMQSIVNRWFAYLSSASAAGSRTTALAPLHLLFTLVISAFLIGLSLMVSTPYLFLLASFCVLTLLLELGAYVYLLIHDRDALRSERFTLEKIRIEKGLIGDSMTGLREIPNGHTIDLSETPRVDE